MNTGCSVSDHRLQVVVHLHFSYSVWLPVINRGDYKAFPPVFVFCRAAVLQVHIDSYTCSGQNLPTAGGSW